MSAQQAKLDEEYFVPLLADPSSYESINPTSVELVGDDVDAVHSFNFRDGTQWDRLRTTNQPTPLDDTTPIVEATD